MSPDSAAALGSDCFAVPGAGKVAKVSAAVSVPVSVYVADLTGQGAQVFEGQAYAALDVRNRVDQLLNSDQHHTLYMLPNAPYLPAGAITYPSAGDIDPQIRYAYTYAAMSLEQLRDALNTGKATLGGEGMVMRGLAPIVPTVADFKLNTPVTLLMLEKRARGVNAMPAGFDVRAYRELKIAYAGRESVTVGSTTYSNACKLSVSARRMAALGPAIESVGQATLWFAPGIGLVKASATNQLLAPLGSIDTTIVPAN